MLTLTYTLIFNKKHIQPKPVIHILCLLSKTINADGTNPFTKPQYLLLNLALGANGGNPDKTKFPIKFEVDYVRVYQTEK